METEEITRRKLAEPTLEILHENRGQPMHVREINDRLADRFEKMWKEKGKKFSDVERKDLNTEAGWARSYVSHRSDIISNTTRGYWQLNEEFNWDKITIKDLNIESIFERGGSNKVEYYARMLEVAEKKFDIEDNNTDRMKRLAESYVRNEVSLFLGAGVSMDVGLPSWSKLIENFDKNLSNDENNKNNEILRRNSESMISQTRIIKNSVSNNSSGDDNSYIKPLEAAIYKDVRDNLADNIRKSHLLTSLVKFIYPENPLGSLTVDKRKCLINEIITFNFDNVLEKKLEQEEKEYHSYPNSVPELQEILNKDGIPNIYHVHGRLEEYDEDNVNIIFSEEEYHQAYNNPFSWSNIIQINSFYKNTCLFVGCSLNDPNMKRLLDASKIDHRTNATAVTTKHYAILEKNLEIPAEFIIENNRDFRNYDELKYSYKSFTEKRQEDGFKLTEDKIPLIKEQENIEIKRWDNYFKSLGVQVIWVNHYSEVTSVIKEIIELAEKVEMKK